jgi:hypothetical protein
MGSAFRQYYVVIDSAQVGGRNSDWEVYLGVLLFELHMTQGAFVFIGGNV